MVSSWVNSFKMSLKIIWAVVCLLPLGDCSQADRAFGFTNFKIKLKSNHGVIDRSPKKVQENIIEDEPLVKLGGGPTYFDQERGVNIPMVFILNERIESPKFVSRQPKRKKIVKVSSQKIKNVSSQNEIEDKRELVKQSIRKPKQKSARRPKQNPSKPDSGNHANILNTNFRFAYLRKMKLKRLAENNQKESKTRSRRLRKVKRVRKKL